MVCVVDRRLEFIVLVVSLGRELRTSRCRGRRGVRFWEWFCVISKGEDDIF